MTANTESTDTQSTGAGSTGINSAGRRFWFSPQWVVAVVVLVIALLAPLFVQTYWLHVLIIAYFYAILASSWSLLAGYAGQFSFAHMAFMALGAYTVGLFGRFLRLSTAPTGTCTEVRLGNLWLVLMNAVGDNCLEAGKANMPVGSLIYRPPLVPGIILGVLVAGLAGLAIGALVLRFRAAYLALFTIAFSEILRTLIRGEPQITRGDHGLRVPALFPDTISRIPYYYTMLAILVASLLFMFWLARSRVGLFLRAIREDEEAAAARGVDVVRYKVLTFVITAMLAGLGGVFLAHYITILSPNIMVLPQMGLVIAMAIIGGVESLLAAAIGALIIQVSLELLREFEAWRLVIFGALLIITLRFARNGLLAPLMQKLAGAVPRPEARGEESTAEVGEEVRV
jgi:branched-chain amino acid transport system permease protein